MNVRYGHRPCSPLVPTSENTKCSSSPAAESREHVSFLFLLEPFLCILMWHGVGRWGPLQSPAPQPPLFGPGPAPQAVIFIPRMLGGCGFRRSVWSATETWRNGRLFLSTWFNAEWQVRLLDDLTHLEFQPICPSPPLSLLWCEPVVSLPPSTRARILTGLGVRAQRGLQGRLADSSPAAHEERSGICFRAGRLWM